MPNELLLFINLVVLYLAVLLWYYLFGTKGLYCFSIFATIAANIEVLILIEAFNMEQTLGNVLFATTFLISDIVSEVNGKREADKLVNTNILTSILFVIVSQLWLLYSPSINDTAMGSIQTLFKSVPRIIFASIFVYALTQRFDVWLYHKWWNFTEKKFNNKDKFLWLRNNGSTLVSQLINAVLYNIVAFAGVYSWETVGSIIATSYIIFIFTSLLDTPIVYLARKIYKKKFMGKNEDEITNNSKLINLNIFHKSSEVAVNNVNQQQSNSKQLEIDNSDIAINNGTKNSDIIHTSNSNVDNKVTNNIDSDIVKIDGEKSNNNIKNK